MAEEPTSTTRDSEPLIVLDYASSTRRLGSPVRTLAIMMAISVILSAVAFTMLPMRPGSKLQWLEIGGVAWLLLCVFFFVQMRRSPRRYRRREMAVAGIGLVGMASIMSMGAMFIPVWYGCRSLSTRAVCGANLRSIGRALYLYAQTDPDGAFPDDINKLISANLITPKQLMCLENPSVKPAYYYVPGYGVNSEPNQAIMFEYPSNHVCEGGNVLYQDDHVMFVKSPRIDELIAGLTLPDGKSYDPDDPFCRATGITP